MTAGADAGRAAGRETEPAAALIARLGLLRERVAELVESRSATDPTAADPLRGLYLSDEAVQHLLAAPPGGVPGQVLPDGSGVSDGVGVPGAEGAPGAPGESGVSRGGPGSGAAGPGSAVPDVGDRLSRLTRRLGLGPLDEAILLLALAPDLDRTFEPLYGYLNDDVSRRRATVGPAIELCGLPVHDAGARARFHPSAPLLALGLLQVDEPERPFLSRSLRVPDRVTAHLLGDDTPDAALAGQVTLLPPAEPMPQASPLVEQLAGRLSAGALTVYLREAREGEALSCATAALAAAGLEALHFAPGQGASGDASAVDPAAPYPAQGEQPTAGLLSDLLREARLRDCPIVVAPVPEKPGPLLRALLAQDTPHDTSRDAVHGSTVHGDTVHGSTGHGTSYDVSVLLAGGRPYDPDWCGRDPLVLDAPRQRSGDLAAWSAALGLAEDTAGADGTGGTDSTVGADDPGGAPSLGFDLAPVVAPYRLGGDRIRRTARAALDLAAFDGVELSAAHLRLAARQQSASGLEQHARRIRPDVTWDDLVLPERPLAQLHELALRARHRDRVLGDWRLSAGGGRGRGALALFAGDSGTGKTLSAEVVAAELGLDLYVVQLSSVVDKYIGETEKNLERIFAEADRTDAVLLFDEADAVFGKRSQVTNSNDRYANLESAYLLQRLESFDGIVLLTTNLRANIDEAFTRRLDLIVDFPFPDVAQRLALWQHSLVHVPCADDIDPGRCAKEFELAGGSIRSAVVTAAYAAAGRGSPVTSADLLAGAQREYRKAGRLVLDDGGW
ncbi:ATP-binding protein [Streptomyces sp. NBC_01089]|uniref:ATP-binding protein n=1 Tax=Streptomyces sp. NBC_01089 TaxID=2903747 RepID=UPI00386C6FA7|nr:ATP-binding protein [Streptomyces sp. NBC_01089]